MAIFIKEVSGVKKYYPYVSVEECIDSIKPLLRTEILTGHCEEFWESYNTRLDKRSYANGGLKLTVAEDFVLLQRVFSQLFYGDISEVFSTFEEMFPCGLGTEYTGDLQNLVPMLYVMASFKDIRYDTRIVEFTEIDDIFGALASFCEDVVGAIEEELSNGSKVTPLNLN